MSASHNPLDQDVDKMVIKKRDHKGNYEESVDDYQEEKEKQGRDPMFKGFGRKKKRNPMKHMTPKKKRRN